jgi:hypothetical protein
MPVWIIPSDMSTANPISHSDLTGAAQTTPKHPQYRRDERSSDSWNDWTGGAEDPAVIEALVQKNAPAIVFGDIVRLLGMTFLIITLIDLSLKAFHLH